MAKLVYEDARGFYYPVPAATSCTFLHDLIAILTHPIVDVIPNTMGDTQIQLLMQRLKTQLATCQHPHTVGCH
ncbi:uncharacterized protein CANTADRAFT_27553 [Suhomyces tanzawaensis NRRL Y-17324]|uniref:Uncharacterized protein n=1 Tax=Suhomyces tanzawaensis NRRL Y-17324 TaxID=984487 RepID=A0A1E4SBC2_9ASCO|nr:uncharacterized protein CANTADRAFT_27553 [Suhomyces tanzawaensis NRRL Y-17324]ODV76778.1 hypothetical protein CANTADRAFT_27553 [Suhomyces tanzawaensis NRRL Y-17324]